MLDLTSQEVKDSIQYEESELLTCLIAVLEDRCETFEVLEGSTSTQIRVEFDEEDLYILVDSENVIYKVENGIKVAVDIDELK